MTAERIMRWSLFTLMAATVPVIYFMFVVAGLLPLSAIAVMSRRGEPGLVIFNAVHLLFYGGVFYLLAWWVAKRLARLPAAWAAAIFPALAGGLAALAFFPLYGVGHSDYAPMNLFRLFHAILYEGY